jgi:hypothetical protein
MKWLLSIIVKLAILLLVVSLVFGFVFYQADQAESVIYTKCTPFFHSATPDGNASSSYR